MNKKDDKKKYIKRRLVFFEIKKKHIKKIKDNILRLFFCEEIKSKNCFYA